MNYKFLVVAFWAVILDSIFKLIRAIDLSVIISLIANRESRSSCRVKQLLTYVFRWQSLCIRMQKSKCIFNY